MSRERKLGDIKTPVETSVEEAPQATDQAVWPELTETEIAYIKDNNIHQGMPLFKFENSGQTYVFRAVSSQEWQGLTKRILEEDARSPVDPAKQDEYICDLAVVWPFVPQEGRAEFWSRNLAGAARSLVIQIRQKSGFSTVTDEGMIVADSLIVTPLEGPRGSVPEPTEDEVANFKNASPNRSVYRAEFPGIYGVHYFRPWTRAEWEQIQTQEERGNDSRDYAVRLALVWSSEDWSQPALAGTVEQLFEAVFSQSGFTAKPVITQL